jgi:hypothetical protein
MSLSHLDCDGGPRSGHHVSLILEGEGEEDEKGASKASLSLDPRNLELMVEHPDSLDALGDSSKKFIQSALGENGASSWFSGASKASLSYEPRPIELMVEHPYSLDAMGGSSKDPKQSALDKSVESLLLSAIKPFDLRGESFGSSSSGERNY